VTPKSGHSNYLSLKYLVGAVRQELSCGILRTKYDPDGATKSKYAFESMHIQYYFRLKISCLNICVFGAIIFHNAAHAAGRSALGGELGREERGSEPCLDRLVMPIHSRGTTCRQRENGQSY
jgi:hypothetical protein